MKTIKVSEATDAALDYLVAETIGANFRIKEKDDLSKHIVLLTPMPCPDNKPGCCVAHYKSVYFSPSTDWSQGGSIIEREGISVAKVLGEQSWSAFLDFGKSYSQSIMHRHCGPTPLIAAMRCFVASKLGDEAEVPGELL